MVTGHLRPSRILPPWQIECVEHAFDDRRRPRNCSLPSKNIAVAVGPGATVLTVMSRPRSSLARISVTAYADSVATRWPNSPELRWTTTTPPRIRRYELYRSLDQDVRTTVAAAPVRVPTLLLTTQGQLDPVRATVAPRITDIVRAMDVPNAGHWLIEENPRFVTAELLRFLDG
ncbi:alpha/beta fold hydrolase [Nocardia flavorosea]|uniref:alpha/beta fold hydrolase n=1 Tax=Nocardia flavorosea TaxID=53429 RepID=UPI000B218AB3|nr:alpha/beta hydrolase [Nocardia flavorosea]